MLKNPIINNARITDLPTEEMPTSTIITASGFVESAAPTEDRREVELLMLDTEESDIYGDDDDDTDLYKQSYAEGSHIQTLKTVSFMVSQNQVQVRLG